MIDASTIVINQMVHGYAEGHREIASSLRLKTRDARTVSVLSDVSSPGLKIAEEGYLTGYPLPEANLYVLARTWPANEVSRPGAVWTHSLLFEFADLPAICDAHELLALFRRPSADLGTDASYRRPFRYDAPRTTARIAHWIEPGDESAAELWASGALDALYGAPKERVIAAVSPAQLPMVEQVVLALWSQQWPRLRRNFRFCTLATSDRQVERVQFDLQVFPESDRASRGRLTGTLLGQSGTSAEATSWREHALADLLSPGPLREFLSAVGGAAAGGRASFVSLATLHQLLSQQNPTPEEADRALVIVRSELEDELPVLTRSVLQALLPHIDRLSSAAVEFVLNHLDALQVQRLTIADAERVGTAIWNVSTSRFVDIILQVDGRLEIAAEAMRAMPVDKLLDGVLEEPRLLDAAFSLRPELLAEERLWNADKGIVDRALAFVATSSGKEISALMAIARTRSDSVQQQAVDLLGPKQVWAAIVEVANSETDAGLRLFASWTRALVGYPDAAAEALASTALRWTACLHVMSKQFGPDAVPNAFGHDPWLVARSATHGKLDRESALFLSSYLFTRALGPVSRSSSELIELVFDEIYSATETDSIPSPAWDMLNARLPQPGLWAKWDRCEQLRHGVAEVYVGRWLSPSSFGALGDDRVFRLLVRAAAREYNGRSYLRDVRQQLDSRGQVSRVELIDKQLDSWL